MTPFLQLALALIIILIAAKLAGLIANRFGQPSVLGEILVGLLLGPSVLDLTHLQIFTDTHLGEILIELGELGVLFLMFIAGLELHIGELAKNTKVSLYAGVLGVIVPALMGIGIGLGFNMPLDVSIFLGLTMGATSVSISAQTLMELKVLRSRVGLGLLGSAVFDDVLVILLLSGFLALTNGSGNALDILWVFLRMVLFIAASVGLGLWVLPKIVQVTIKLPVSQGLLTLALIVLMTYGIAAEIFGGMASITGAFIAGLMFARSPEKNRLETNMSALAYSFFVPIFFVSIGLSVNIRELNIDALWLVILVSVASILGKLLGAGSGALLGGFTKKESLQLGIGMISRGEVGLIVAAVGLAQGLFKSTEFSAIVGMVILSTIVTPPLLRASFKQTPRPSEKISPPLPSPQGKEGS